LLPAPAFWFTRALVAVPRPLPVLAVRRSYLIVGPIPMPEALRRYLAVVYMPLPAAPLLIVAGT
jgi:hypothetical protein